MKRKLRKTVMLLAVMLAVATPLNAQVYILDDEFEGKLRSGYEDYDLVVPMNASDNDQYVPIGNGVLATAILGGFYLLSKRKKDRND